MTKFFCNRQVRVLLAELDDAIEKYESLNIVIHSSAQNEKVSNMEFIEMGAKKEAMRTYIIGIAVKINKASKSKSKKIQKTVTKKVKPRRIPTLVEIFSS